MSTHTATVTGYTTLDVVRETEPHPYHTRQDGEQFTYLTADGTEIIRIEARSGQLWIDHRNSDGWGHVLTLRTAAFDHDEAADIIVTMLRIAASHLNEPASA